MAKLKVFAITIAFYSSADHQNKVVKYYLALESYFFSFLVEIVGYSTA
jgi:hypothetical protein